MGIRGEHPVPFAVILERPDWQFESVCYLENVRPSIFFPPQATHGGGKAKKAYKEAQQYCNRCETRAECLEYAITNKLTNGMYGGETPAAIRRMIRQRKKEANGNKAPIDALSGCERNEDGKWVSKNGRVLHTKEQKAEFVKRARVVGVRQTMRELGYPSSPGTASRWMRN